ncbi:hypothetical protein ANN_14678 [Periplaneta americana]|uniref:PiggyBac transposable element-derived protein domain-containing protein n=1 Tax=Periplaneta americana TaxID=6978 RepID=A0ABQ8SX02_PERAM|nr:hypothetical protein ANN_14678 [Periplaneta americana]
MNFAPTIESASKNDEDTFLEERPWEIMHAGKSHNVRTIMGTNKYEAALFMSKVPVPSEDKLDEYIAHHLEKYQGSKSQDYKDELSRKIKITYYGNNTVTNGTIDCQNVSEFSHRKEVTAMVNEDNIDDASDPEEDDNVVTYDSDTEYHREIESDSSSRSSSPDQQHASTSNIAVIARSGREYTTAPPRQVRRIFQKFITPEIVNIIVHHTNEDASIRNLKLTNTEELYAFIGILILMGANKDSELPIDDLWGKVLGKNIYTATMNRIRFGELLSLIRFDDKQTRTERRKQDKFCPIREVFYKIDELFVKYYIPSAHLTIDEMLSLFRGRCPFKMLSDAHTRYILKMEVYAGKDERPAEERSAKAVVRRLVKPLEGTGRNVTTDRYYTSIELAEELYNDDKLTLVGTLKSNRRHIPEELKKTQGRAIFL